MNIQQHRTQAITQRNRSVKHLRMLREQRKNASTTNECLALDKNIEDIQEAVASLNKTILSSYE